MISHGKTRIVPEFAHSIAVFVSPTIGGFHSGEIRRSVCCAAIRGFLDPEAEYEQHGDVVFPCHVSRMFTIHKRTPKVCLDCGHEFGLPDANASDRYSISEVVERA